jgi:thymidylate kinase
MPSAQDEAIRHGDVHGAGCSRPALVRAFLRSLEEQRIGWVVLGRGLDAALEAGGDVDVVVEQAQVAQLPRLVWRFCETAGVRCARVMQHEWNAFNFALVWRDARNGELQVLQLDLCGDFERSGRSFVAAAELIESRVRSSADPEVFVPSPALEFISYLLKKLDKQDLDAAALEHLRARWCEAPWASMAQLRRFFDEASAQELARALDARDLAALERAWPALRARLRRRVRPGAANRLREARRLARRLRHPVGYWIAFLGPDGSGKSTVARRVGAELAPLFRSVHDYHLRPHWLGRPRSHEPVLDPHGSPVRGRLASLAKLGLWWADCTAGFLFDLYPRLVRGQLLLFDRHFSDLLVDPRRYRYAGSQRLASAVCASTFGPALFVLLDAPVDVIHARKREVAREEVERQLGDYRRLLHRFSSHHAVDATRSVDDVAAEITDGIVARLERRTAARLGLAPAKVESDVRFARARGDATLGDVQ